MDASIALILAQDGITTGAVYALLAVGLVLVFAVTQVIFIPQGEMVAYGALTIATMQSGVFPSTAWLLLAMGAAVFAMDLWNWLRRANAGEANREYSNSRSAEYPVRFAAESSRRRPPPSRRAG